MTPDYELEEIKARHAINMAEEAQRELKKAAPQIERFTETAAIFSKIENDLSTSHLEK